jgi:CO/xanthine dehydrogenase FAD-binding subunit
MLRLPKFRYYTPETLEEVLSLLIQFKGDTKLVAGGTDLLPRLKRNEIAPKRLISLGKIEGLGKIERKDHVLMIGPVVSHDTLGKTDLFPPKALDGLKKACGTLSSPQIRAMGTIGGNICNASPSADSLPSLLALDAQVEVVSPEGRRLIGIDQFFQGPFQSDLKPDEVLTNILIPIPETPCASVYVKLPKATEKDETLVGISICCELSLSSATFGKVRIAMGSVGPTPLRAKRAEASVEGKEISRQIFEEAAAVASEEARPRSRAEYRREMIRHLVPIAFRTVLEKMGIGI